MNCSPPFVQTYSGRPETPKVMSHTIKRQQNPIYNATKQPKFHIRYKLRMPNKQEVLPRTGNSQSKKNHTDATDNGSVPLESDKPASAKFFHFSNSSYCKPSVLLPPPYHRYKPHFPAWKKYPPRTHLHHAVTKHFRRIPCHEEKPLA